MKKARGQTLDEFTAELVKSIKTWTSAEKAGAREAIRKGFRKPLKDRLYKKVQ